MVKTLITTRLGLNQNKNINISNFLLLGEWCLLSDDDPNQFEIVSYHWKDRKKLFFDYEKLNNIYEYFLQILSEGLNKYHSEDLPLEYWRILIGPWLQNFIHTVFDRWEMMNKANKEFNIDNMLSFRNLRVENFIPYNFVDYDIRTQSHNWNQFVYSYIGRFLDINQNEVLELPSKSNQKKNYKNAFIKLFNLFSNKINSKKDIFLYSTKLNLKNYIYMQFLLKQFPTVWHRVQSPLIVPNIKTRFNILENIKFIDDLFFQLLVNLIPLQIPSIYVEGFLKLNQYSKRYLPRYSKLVVDSVAWHSDDVFKNWVALKKIKNNTKFLISQHGGNYGISLFNSTEEHQIKVSDIFLSWGWKNKSSKVKNLGTFIYQNHLIKNKLRSKNSEIILIQGLSSKYSSFIFASPISASQWFSYLNDQKIFVNNLKKDVQENLTIKLYKNSFQYNEDLIFKKNFPKVKIYDGEKSLLNILDSFSLAVTTYNATTFLETMMLNFPTVIFWNSNHWELRMESKIIFDKLKKVGVFHESSFAAAEFVNKISKDISGWWFSKDLQLVRKEFVTQYARNISLKHFSEYLKKSIKI